MPDLTLEQVRKAGRFAWSDGGAVWIGMSGATISKMATVGRAMTGVVPLPIAGVGLAACRIGMQRELDEARRHMLETTANTTANESALRGVKWQQAMIRHGF